MILSPEIQKAAEWLQSQAKENPFAEIGIKLILHAGKISRYEHLIITKQKPTETGCCNDERI